MWLGKLDSTVLVGSEEIAHEVGAYLYERGLEASMMQYPAVPKGAARIRLFVTSEHTREQLQQASELILETAAKFGFSLG